MSKQELRIERIDSGSEEAVIAQALDRGLCLLTQRITAERNQNGERIVDYLAIKRGKR